MKIKTEEKTNTIGQYNLKSHTTEVTIEKSFNVNMELSEAEFYALTSIFDQARCAFAKRKIELIKQGLPYERLEYLENLSNRFFVEI